MSAATAAAAESSSVITIKNAIQHPQKQSSCKKTAASSVPTTKSHIFIVTSYLMTNDTNDDMEMLEFRKSEVLESILSIRRHYEDPSEVDIIMSEGSTYRYGFNSCTFPTVNTMLYYPNPEETFRHKSFGDYLLFMNAMMSPTILNNFKTHNSNFKTISKLSGRYILNRSFDRIRHDNHGMCCYTHKGNHMLTMFFAIKKKDYPSFVFDMFTVRNTFHNLIFIELFIENIFGNHKWIPVDYHVDTLHVGGNVVGCGYSWVLY